MSQYVLPLSAPLDEFPWEPTAGCTDTMRDWLADHGQERQRDWLVDVRSAAGGGKSMLAITEIRLSGEVSDSDPDEPVMLFDCPSAGQTDLVTAKMPIAADTVAVDYSDGQPMAINLAPGEVAQLRVIFTGGSGTDGDLVSDVTSGGEVAKAVLIPQELLSLSSLGRWSNLVVSVGSAPGEFYCATVDHSELEDCGPSTIPDYADLWSE